MKKRTQKVIAVAGAITMLGGAVGALAACNKVNTDGIKDGYNIYTSVMPSNWNELTYKDNNDTQIMSYIGSSFFEADFAFDKDKGGKFTSDGKINQEALISDGYEIKYSAATAIKDVTSEYKTRAGWNEFYSDPENAGDGYIWEITLREDLQWDDGTPIDATDFVYTMKQQLDPLFKNYRANSFYDNIYLLNAYNYFMSADDTIFVTPASQGLTSNGDVATSDKSVDKKVYLDLWNFFGAEGAPSCTFELEYNDDGDEENPPTVKSSSLTFDYDRTPEQYTDVEDTTYYFDYGFLAKEKPEYITEDGTIDAAQIVADKFDFGDYVFNAKMLYEGYAAQFEVGAPYHRFIGMKIANPNKGFSFDKVGIYSPSKYKIVVAFEKQMFDLVDEGGNLAYNASYELASLPLVKEELYEQCKVAPVTGSTLWTTKYNTSLDTTASWGPYKLTAFQSGKSYTLERNDKWYGYKLDDNKDQYLVTKINCEKITESSTVWMGLFNGTLDTAGIDSTHKDEYRNSKYAKYTPGSATFNQNIYSDLSGLLKSGRNNGILAIKDFRKAISLAYDRAAYNAATTTAHQPALGLLNNSYYYDIANNKRYRDTDQAKKAILRSYGCTEDPATGKWSNGEGGNIQNASLEDAYEMVNGFDLNQAKQLVASAYTELTTNAEKYGYDPNKKIEILYGTSADNDSTRLDYEYIKNDIFGKLVEDTPLEGKIEVTFSAEFGSTWYEDYVGGKYDLCGGGMSGAIFNPSVILGSFVQAADSLAPWWENEDPITGWNEETAEQRAEKFPDAYIAFKLPAGNYGTVAANADIVAGTTIYITAPNLYRCLTGQASAAKYGDNYVYNFDNRVVDEDIRLEVYAALEEKVLSQYYSIPTTSQNSASILGAKFSYVTEDYNVFLGHGGIRYLRVNYSFDEWKQFVVDNKGDLSKEYRKTV